MNTVGSPVAETQELGTDERSISQLVRDLTEQTSRLVRTEAPLAAGEVAVKARRCALSVAGALAVYAGFARMTTITGWSSPRPRLARNQ